MTRRRAVAPREPLPEPYTPPTLPTPTPEPVHPERTKRTAKRWESRDVMLPGIDDGPRALLYGEQRLGGKLQFVHYNKNGNQLWCVVELAAGECNALLDVKMSDGRSAPTPGVAPAVWQYWWYPGTAAGEVCAPMAAAVPGWNEAFPGTSYVVFVLRRFGSYWKGEIPELVWRFQAKKCLRPEGGAEVYSENGWDQWHDYVRHPEGKALPATRVDSASFLAARNADTTNGIKVASHFGLLEATDPDSAIETFRMMMRAWWFPDANKFRVVADRAGSPVATYDDAHVSDQGQTDLVRSDPVERANKTTIWYTDTTNGWQLTPYSYPETDPVGVDIVEEEFRLPHLHDPAQVKELAVYMHNSRLFDASCRERWLASTDDRELGDIVTRTFEEHGLSMQMRILGRTKNPDGTFEVQLVQHDNAKFSTFALTDAPKIASTLPDPSELPPNVDTGTVTWNVELFDVGSSANQLPRGVLTFTMPEFAYLEDVEVWLAIDGGPSRFWFETTSGTVVTPVLWESGAYQLTFRSRQSITQELTVGSVFNVAVTGAEDLPGGLSFQLSNEAISIQTDSAGSGGDFSGATGVVKVLTGVTDVTAAATIGAATVVGCTGTVNTAANTPVAGQPKGFYRVTAMSADSAYLEIPITYAGVTVNRRFNLSKSKQGPQGPQGPASYTWIKYADTPTTGMSDSPTGKTYIGLAINKATATESTNYADYTWSLIKGDQGVQGPAGADGQPTYTWIKYATSAAGAGLSDDPTGKTYIGLAHNKTTAVESTNPADYSWAKFEGPQGPQGPASYTWIKYADTPTTGMSDSPTGKTYIGLATNKATATESTNYADYTWSLIKGDQGVQGPAGADGQPTYTWIKYATSAAGAGLSDDPTGKTYIGLAHNKTTSVESTNPADYTWSKFEGPQGAAAKIMWVTSDRQIIVYGQGGEPTPSTQAINLTANKQNTTAGVTWSVLRADGTASGAAATVGNTKAITAAEFDLWRGTTDGILVQASLTDGVTITDSISIVRLVQEDVSFVPHGLAGAMRIVGNTIERVSGATGWSAGVHSRLGFANRCSARFRAGQANQNIMVGINADPTANASYTSLDYCFYLQTSGQVTIYESGVAFGTSWPYAAGDQFIITFDGAFVYLYQNKTLRLSRARAVGAELFLDSSFYAVGGKIYDVEFENIGDAPPAVSSHTEVSVAGDTMGDFYGYKWPKPSPDVVGYRISGSNGLEREIDFTPGSDGPAINIRPYYVDTWDFDLATQRAYIKNRTAGANVYAIGKNRLESLPYQLISKILNLTPADNGIVAGSTFGAAFLEGSLTTSSSRLVTNGTFTFWDVTVTGASATTPDIVCGVHVPGTIVANGLIVASAVVYLANTVRITVYNLTGGNVTVNSGSVFKAIVMKR